MPINRVAEVRKSLQLTQEKLAQLAGLTTSTIQAIEGGMSPRLATAQALSRVLKSTVDELFPAAEPEEAVS